MESQGLTIGRVAKCAGVSIETVRFYERQGLIPEPPRTASGYRQFPAKTVARIRFIQRAQELGFSLREIDELIALRLDGSSTKGDVKARAEAKMLDIDTKIRDLRRMREKLSELTRACSGEGETAECPILEALTEGDE
jgi:Hg(II)-responsive transcriptional regulator